uniref:Ulp1 protease family, C-terminal catalytic domain-containing protein n=1 Tax=Tanacetum cinerariifolium TaxID=118510 RepID=A0A699JPB3_TANCI|nr:hypothetical protein [Tanacetum cinerariifolium]
MKKKSKIYDENNKNSKIRTRTTPTALFNAMVILNGDRKKCLDEMGFGSMIGMGIHELSGKLESVHDILGIPMGGCSLESLAPRSPDDPSLKSGVCNMNILKKITDDVCVEKIDWCSYIIKCLKESKQKWVNLDKNHYTGLVTFMILLYLHFTRCDDIDVIRKTPAIKNWKSIHMQYREKLEIEKYGRFGVLPKHEPLNLQSEDFIKMIQEKCYNVHQDLRSVKETINEGLSRFPDCKKLNKLVKKFGEDLKKKDLVRNDENDDTTATTNDKNNLLHFDSKMESDSHASDDNNQNSVDDDGKQDDDMDEIDKQNKEDIRKEDNGDQIVEHNDSNEDTGNTDSAFVDIRDEQNNDDSEHSNNADAKFEKEDEEFDALAITICNVCHPVPLRVLMPNEVNIIE